MIPLFSPIRQNEAYFQAMEADFARILRSGTYVLGPEVGAFEEELASRCGYRFAVGCSSGTEALILSLKALELPPNAEVITSSFSFVASASSILWAGHRPVLADVSPETGCLRLEDVAPLVNERTRAIIAVDLFGRQAEIAGLRELAAEKGLFLIEDGAQSIGVPNSGAHLCTLSFYPTKNVGALGDAGAILTDDEGLALKLRRLIQHGGMVRDHYDAIGTNARIDTLQAAWLTPKLKENARWAESRRQIAEEYREALIPLERQGKIQLPPPASPRESSVWSLFTLRVPAGRDNVAEQLRAKGVGCGVYYSRALSQQPALLAFVPPAGCPNAERLCDTVLSIPIYPELSSLERRKVVDSLLQCDFPTSTSSCTSP